MAGYVSQTQHHRLPCSRLSRDGRQRNRRRYAVMWNRDLKLKISLIASTACAAFVMMIWHGMRFDWTSAGAGLGTICLLLPFATIFSSRGVDQFANLLTGFLCMVAFNMCLAVLTYAGTPLNAPLADDWLIRSDAAMGIHLPSIVKWTASHSWMRVFNLAYDTVLPSTLLAIIVLGFDKDVRRLQDFVSHFMIAGLLTTVIYFFVPAIAPTAAFGYEATPAQMRFLEHLTALRQGQFSVVSLNRLEGLITFPSFHTSWALLLAWSFRHYRYLRMPMLLLNIAVAVSTVTTGWHYATDVIGGLLIAVVSVSITSWLRRWSEVEVAAFTAPQIS